MDEPQVEANVLPVPGDRWLARIVYAYRRLRAVSPHRQFIEIDTVLPGGIPTGPYIVRAYTWEGLTGCLSIDLLPRETWLNQLMDMEMREAMVRASRVQRGSA